jgi:aldehyde:ferredoxin oxidoreductase
MSEGPAEQMIRVDMSTQTATVEDFPERWNLLGGRSLSARILNEECDPTCEPLGPDNVLVLAPGVLSGTAAPTSGRLSVGAKSPLTGGIKEANAGGNPAQDLMKLGYRVVVVSGQPADPDKRYALDISADGVSMKEVPDCAGLWNYALIEHLAKTYTPSASFISIGPAGEQRMSGASVACTDADEVRRPARHAARGGLGAVMGSKGLKYVAVDAGKLRVRTALDRKAFTGLCKGTSKEYLAGPQMLKHGTSTSVGMANTMFTFPYKNRIEGQSPDAEALDGNRIVESFEERGGGMHNCMTGCIISCSNIVHDADGNYKTSALEFETLTLLGSSCAIDSWDKVAELDRLCDEVGLDTIETGAAIAILMDSGGMEWGDAKAAAALIKEIADDTELGRAVGNGAVATGKHRKHARVPHSRGQAIPAWDPRPLKATGITYAAGPMGADHTAGLVVNPGLIDPTEQANASQDAQLVNAACDSSGFCQFIAPSLDLIREYYGVFYGEEISREQIADQGWQVLQDEWAFNTAAGWKDEDNVLSDCLVEEGIGPDHSLKFDVDLATINLSKQRFPAREELYTMKAAG